MKTPWLRHFVLTLAVSWLIVSLSAVTAQTVALVDCLTESPGAGDWTDRGIYVTQYPGTSIDTVTLQMSRSGYAAGDFNITLQALANTFDGPLVATGNVTAHLGSTKSNVEFPMLKGIQRNPPVQPGTTVCFKLTVTSGALVYIGTVGDLTVDYPDATDPCPLVVETEDTTPPLSSFRRDGVAIKITGDARLLSPPFHSISHLTDAANIGYHTSIIDDPALNGRPDLKLFITNNRAGLPHNHPIAAYYYSERWRIFNEDYFAMPVGLRVNVVAFEPAAGVFNQNTFSTNTAGHITTLDHPFLNGNPDARLVVSRDWSVGNGYNPNPTGVWYDSGAGRWTIYNQNIVAMPMNINFNIHADLTGAHSFTHMTTAANLVSGGASTTLDHPRLNGNPNAIITATHDWKGIYISSPLGVSYQAGRWHVLREDGVNLVPNLSFNILIGEPSAASPPLEIANTGSQIKLWNHHPLGIIQHSANLQPPWTLFTTSANPHTFTATPPRDFFRLFLRPDPAVWHIGAWIIRRDSPTAGRVRIRAEIRNFGGSYFSGSGQQLVTLSEHLPSGATTVVAQQDFTSLATGGYLSLVIEREWSAATEPPPEYILSIIYDPAIGSDGNPSNDDCHLLNNRFTLNGHDIHALFN